MPPDAAADYLEGHHLPWLRITALTENDLTAYLLQQARGLAPQIHLFPYVSQALAIG